MPLEGDLGRHQQRFQSSAAYSPTRAQRTRDLYRRFHRGNPYYVGKTVAAV